MFDFLSEISPYWWLAFAFAIGVLEMLSGTTWLLWPALSALATGFFLFAKPDLSGGSQLLTFAVLAVLFTLAGRWAMSRLDSRRQEGRALNSPAERMVGRRAVVVSFEGPEGRVEIDGTYWHAKWAEGQAASKGDAVRINGAEGSTLLVCAD